MRSRARGFSLLEVMVAVGLLGLFLTVILSAQGGLAASNRSAANMGTAMHLGRCRMTELEEKLLKLGYAENDESDSSAACCDEKETSGFTCEWKVDRVTLPDPPKSDAADGGFLNLAGSSLDAGAPAAPSAPLGAVPGLDFDGGSGLQALGGSVAGQFGGAGGASGMLQMVFGIVYPALKPVLEASIRRISVTVRWKEGEKAREFALVQYVTNPQKAGLLGQSPFAAADGGVPFPPATGGGGAPGAAPAFPLPTPRSP